MTKSGFSHRTELIRLIKPRLIKRMVNEMFILEVTKCYC